MKILVFLILVMSLSVQSNENFILVDPEKRIRGFYDGTDINAMDELLSDIKVLQMEYPSPWEFTKNLILNMELSIFTL